MPRPEEWNTASIPQILRDSEFKGKTTLKRIEPHRLRELILEDLKIYGASSIKKINTRIGEEMKYKSIQRMLKSLINDNMVVSDIRSRRQLNLTDGHIHRREAKESLES